MTSLLENLVRPLVIALLTAALTLGCSWMPGDAMAGNGASPGLQQDYSWIDAYRNRNDVLRAQTLQNAEQLFRHYRIRSALFAESMDHMDTRWNIAWRWAADTAWLNKPPDAPSLLALYLTQLFAETVVSGEILRLDLLQMLAEFATALELNAATYFGDTMRAPQFKAFHEQWRTELEEMAESLASLHGALTISGTELGASAMASLAADLSLDVAWFTVLVMSLFTPLKVAAPMVLSSGGMRLLRRQLAAEMRDYQEAAQEEAIEMLETLKRWVTHGHGDKPGLRVVLAEAQDEFEQAVWSARR